MLVALFQSSDYRLIALKWLIVSFFGIFLSLIWLVIQNRILNFQEFYETLLDDLEKETYCDEFREKFSIGKKNRKFKENVEKGLGGIVRAKTIQRWTPLLMTAGWCLGFIIGKF